RGEDRLADLRVPAAAAEIPREPFPDVRLGGARDAPEQVMRGHQVTRDAKPALDRAVEHERLLKSSRSAVDLQPLDRGDRCSIGFDRQHQARVDRPVRHQHRARAALTQIAALLGAGQAKTIAQEVEQRRAGLDLDRVLRPVDGNVDPLPGDGHAQAARRRSIAVASARRLMTRSIAVRYSRLPRTSEIGLALVSICASSSSFASASPPAAASSPLSSVTANGVGPTAPYANVVRPVDSTRQHRLMVARSTPRRRVTRANAAPRRAGGSGSSIEVASSPGWSTVLPGPTKKC